jgi:2',3'-cyclic-nucleotide 2'-phosphodiesterase (5'-nucleotidase family)
MTKIKRSSLALIILIIFAVSSALVLLNISREEVTLTIVYTNDTHARYTYDEDNNTIGYSKLMTIVNQEEADLLLSAGDIYHGISFGTIDQGESIAAMMKAVGYDAMAPGNHDFNYGSDRLTELEKLSETPILGANVLEIDSSESFFQQDYLIKEINIEGETVKVGIFGLINPDIYDEISDKDVSGLTFGTEESTIETAQQCADTLTEEKCDVIIALTHIGDSDSGIMKSEKLAENTEGIDLIIDGHSHDVENTVIGDTLIVQSGYYYDAVGVVALTLEENIIKLESAYTVTGKTGNIIKVEDAGDDEIHSDEEIENLIESLVKKQEPILDEVVGYSPVYLGGTPGNLWPEIRTGELNLGRVITDAYCYNTGADIAIENAGAIRSEIAEGNITKGDVINTLPFGNYLVTKELTGSDITSLLESSLTIGAENQEAYQSGGDFPKNSGSYLQWSGVDVEYNPAAADGQKVISVKINGEELQPNQTYTIACNNYIAESDNYKELQTADVVTEYDACDEALIDYLNHAGEQRFTDAVNNQRITEIQ